MVGVAFARSKTSNLKLTRARRRILLTWLVDLVVPKHPKRVTFVCKRRFGYSGNIRAICSEFAATSEFEANLWFDGDLPESTRSTLEEQGVRILGDFSLASLYWLVSSGLVVVDHSARDAYITRRSLGRTIVNLWHGVPIKNIELGMPNLSESRRCQIEKTSGLYDALIASSAEDQQAMSQAFGVPLPRVFVTGLPRYDMLLGRKPLARDLLIEEQQLLTVLNGRRLILYSPTFRESGVSPVSQLSAGDWQLLSEALTATNAVLGVRSHPYDSTPCPQGLAGIVELNASRFAETNLVLRHTSILVSDFSSIWVDFLLLSRPIAGFAKDLEVYRSLERGFIYDMEEVFPGPFFNSAQVLAEWLVQQLSAERPLQEHPMQLARFHQLANESYSELTLKALCRLTNSRSVRRRSRCPSISVV